MPLFEFLMGQAGSIACEKLVEGAAKSWKNTRSPVITQARLGGIAPETIMTFASASELFTGRYEDDTRPFYFLDSDERNGWGGELRFQFVVYNPTAESLFVEGISGNKQAVNMKPCSSVCFPEEVIMRSRLMRFLSDLDRNGPSMQLYELSGPQRITRSEAYYFDEVPVEIQAGDSVNFSIIFTAKARAYSVKPYVRLRLGQQQEVYDVPMSRPAYLYPTNCVPAEERYVRTASDVAPFFRIAGSPVL